MSMMGRVMRHPRVARGQGVYPLKGYSASCAVWPGQQFAQGAACGAWIVTLDGDGQNDPADIPTS